MTNNPEPNLPIGKGRTIKPKGPDLYMQLRLECLTLATQNASQVRTIAPYDMAQQYFDWVKTGIPKQTKI